MKQRLRIYYSSEQRNLMWDRWQNAYVERYNRTVRYSWLSQYLFESIKEVQDYATGWLWFYNHERPNKANGGLPPKHMLSAA